MFRFQIVDQKVVYFLVDIRLDLILFYSKVMTSATDVIELDTGPEIVLMTVTMVSVDLVAGVGVEEEEAAVVVVVVVDTDPPRQDVVDGMYYTCNNEFQKIFIMQLIKLCWKFTSVVSDLRWFSPGTPVSSTNKTDSHNITEIVGIKHHNSPLVLSLTDNYLTR